MPNHRALLTNAFSTQPGRRLGAGLLVLRVYVGGALLIAHALPKLRELGSGDPHFVQLVATLGFPAPELFAWLAALTQAAGSAALILGLMTRPAALGVASTLVVGMIGVHVGDPFAVVEAGISYVAAMSTLAIVGPGDLSLDRRIHRTLFGPASDARDGVTDRRLRSC